MLLLKREPELPAGPEGPLQPSAGARRRVAVGHPNLLISIMYCIVLYCMDEEIGVYCIIQYNALPNCKVYGSTVLYCTLHYCNVHYRVVYNYNSVIP